MSWALNYALAGLRPWPYHLVNVLLHAGNAALVASLFLWMAGRRPGSDGRGAAALGACLFAASPMAAETVAYVSSRSTALATLFGLASLRLAVGALDGSGRRLVLAVALYLAALATKEEAAAVPLLLLLLDYFFVAGQRPRELVAEVEGPPRLRGPDRGWTGRAAGAYGRLAAGARPCRRCATWRRSWPSSRSTS